MARGLPLAILIGMPAIAELQLQLLGHRLQPFRPGRSGKALVKAPSCVIVSFATI